MIVGIPKEVKIREYRVGLIPAGVAQLVKAGHTVLVESGAGVGAGLENDAYVEAGGEIVDTAKEVWDRAEMIVKVKEPIPAEYSFMREGQLLYTYLHLAADVRLADELCKKKVTSVAYETIELKDGSLPALIPMSAVAGRMSVQVGAVCLEKENGGKGILLGGVPGVRRGKVVILGGGIVGLNAAKMAMGLGAVVTIMDINVERLAYIDDVFFGRIQTMYSDPHTIAQQIVDCDLVVGAVLIAGARAPHLIRREMLKKMEKGTVVVDVSVDQGGCIETTKPTTHEDPTFVVDGVLHYCVANMPGAVPRTSTFALNNATVPYALELANKGFEEAVKNPALALGVNTYKGEVPHKAVAEAVNHDYVPLKKLLS
jgi:alanine dehydrogenase